MHTAEGIHVNLCINVYIPMLICKYIINHETY